jgi:hypothetical protein
MDRNENLNPSPLDELEEKTYQSRFDDGLLDLLIGFGVLGFAIGILMGEPMITILSPAIAPILWKSLQEKITIPRMGYVRFSAERRKKERRGMWDLRIVLFASLLLGAGAWFALERGGGSLNLADVELGIAPVGVIVAVLMVVGAATGAIMALAGIILLGRFLQRYPAQPAGA